MMREILFRAKTQEGDWTCGYYVFTPKRTGMFGQTIGSADFDRHYILTMKYNLVKEVISETVGQYTGLTDTNGKKIFEGDIVKIYLLGGIEIGRITYSEKSCRFKFADKYGSTYGFDDTCTFEVIANIHDNPELLKEGVSNA